MQVVLFVLQIIGWILLIALTLILVAASIVLFHPAKYLLDVHWLEEKKARFQIHWCFRMIRAKMSYGDDLIYAEANLFGKKKTFSYDFTEEKESEPSNEKETSEKPQEGIVSKIKGIIERIKNAYPKIKKVLEDERNKEAISHIKKELIYLCKVLLPKKSKVDAAYSLGSPDKTGQSFGILACFPAMYCKNWKVLPDFTSDDIYFKGSIWGKGEFYGYQIISIILRLVFDKNCRRLYTIIRALVRRLK